jgi:hypothetical protein
MKMEIIKIDKYLEPEIIGSFETSSFAEVEPKVKEFIKKKNIRGGMWVTAEPYGYLKTMKFNIGARKSC